MYADKTEDYYDSSKIVDRREMLRIKVKSLAAEANIIRKEEKKAFGILRDELHNHRVQQLRKAARHTYLAYGFIRGRSLEQMENVRLSEPDWNAVRVMLKRYGPKNMLCPAGVPQLPANKAISRGVSLLLANETTIESVA